MSAVVLAVHKSTSHSFTKYAEDSITLVQGIGVEGDAHSGTTVKHRSRVARDPSQPNLRQVHLLHAELFDELMDKDHPVFPGDMGENITTRGIDLLALPTGTRLHIGQGGAVDVAGQRAVHVDGRRVVLAGGHDSPRPGKSEAGWHLTTPRVRLEPGAGSQGIRW